MGALVASRKRHPANDEQPSKVFRTIEPDKFIQLLIHAVCYASREATGQHEVAEILDDFYTNFRGTAGPVSAFHQHLLRLR